MGLARSRIPFLSGPGGTGPSYGSTKEPEEAQALLQDERTSPVGLSTAEAAALLKKYGPNKLDASDKEPFLSVLQRQLLNVIFVLTTISSTICFITGEKEKAIFYISLVFCVCLITTIGEYTGQNPSEELLKMMQQSAVVIRDGEKHTIAAEELVPGDVVHLNVGERVPADLKVLRSFDLQTNEATLTGEASEQYKTVEPRDKDVAFPSNMLYKSTDVVAGTGIGEVVATGMNTQVGLIARRLQAEAPRSLLDKLNPLQRSVNQLGQLIACACASIIVFTTVLAYGTAYQSLPLSCSVSDRTCLAIAAVQRALLMAIGIIPHGMPLVVTVMLRIGASLMASRNALVTRRSAVDCLGAANVICTDKTGTLTEGKMAVKAVTSFLRGDEHRAASREELAFYPLRGLDPSGGVFESADLTEAQTSAIDAGMPLTALGIKDLCAAPPSSPVEALATTLLTAAFLGSHGVKLYQDTSSQAWKAEGNMSEAALKVAAAKAGFADWSGKGQAAMAAYPRDDTLSVAFTPNRKMSATVHALAGGGGSFASLDMDPATTHLALFKGAPDRLVPYLSALLEAPREGLSLKISGISEKERDAINAENQSFANQALRSLLLCARPLVAAEVAELRRAESPQHRLDLLLASGSLVVFLGLAGIFDPPRPSVLPSIQICHQAGIRVVMITGDQQATAVAIAKQVGILPEHSYDARLARRCADLRPAKEVDEMVSETVVWSRATPADKVTIVQSLLNQRLVATMTGDGVNDAPALKLADVGVAMGISGTAVAKSSAAMILMDDNFSTIVGAVAEGRRIYGNLQKYVTFVLSVKASECVALIVAILLRTPMPVEGMLTLTNVVVTHIIPPMSVAWEEAESYTMRLPPRNTDDDLIVKRVHMIYRWAPWVIFHSLLITGINITAVTLQTGYSSIDQLAGSSSPSAVTDGLSPCALAGTLAADGSFEADAAPYMCRCTQRPWPFSEPQVVEQWGRINSDAVPIDPWSGNTGSGFNFAGSVFATENFGDIFKLCKDKHGVSHTCWKDPLAPRPVLGRTTNCAAYGATLAHSVTYASLQLSEIFALVTYRTDAPFWQARFSNSYAFVLIMNLSALALMLYTPPVASFLKLAPLTLNRLLLALIVPVATVLLSEVNKANYRHHLASWLREAEVVPQAKTFEP